MSFVYFTDRDLGKRFPEILKSGGLTVERHSDHFGDDAPDELWLEQVGKRGRIALTHDRRIRYKPWCGHFSPHSQRFVPREKALLFNDFSHFPSAP